MKRIFFLTLFFFSASICFAQEDYQRKYTSIYSNFKIFFIQNQYTNALVELDKWENLVLETYNSNHIDFARLSQNRGLMYYNLKEYEKAINYYNIAENKYKNIDTNHLHLAILAYNRANLFYTIKDYNNALDYYLDSEKRYKMENKDHPSLLNVMYTIASIYRYFKKHDNELEYLNRIIDKYDIKTEDINFIIKIIKRCAKIHEEKGQYINAINYYKNAVKIYNTKNNFKFELGYLYSNIGLFYMILGQYSEALEYSLKAETILKATDDYHSLLPPLIGLIGDIYSKLLRYKESLQYYIDAEKRYRYINGNAKDLFAIYYALGMLYIDFNQYDEALLCFDNAEKNIIENKTDPVHLVDISLNRGRIYNDLGQYNKAFELFDKAEKEYKKYGDKFYSIAVIEVNRGVYYQNVGKFEEAIIHYKNAEEIYKKNTKNHLDLAYIAVLCGIVYESLGEFNKALKCYNSADIQCLQQGITEWIISYHEAITLKKMNEDINKIRNKLTEAEKRANSIRKEILSEESKIAYSEDPMIIYSTGSYLEILDMKFEDGLKIIERGKARGILEKINQNKIWNSYLSDVDIKNKIETFHLKIKEQEKIEIELTQKLKQYLSAKRKSFENYSIKNIMEKFNIQAKDEPYLEEILTKKINSIRSEQINIKSNLDKEIGKLPVISNVVGKFELSKVINSLNKNEIIFYFSLVQFENNLIVYRISKEEIGADIIKLDSTFETKCKTLLSKLKKYTELDEDKFIKALKSKGKQENDAKEIRELGEKIYDVILKPVESKLSGKNEWIIIPDGILNYIPFDVLCRNGKYLIEGGIKISQVASLKVWQALKNREKTDKKGLFAVAPFYESGDRAVIALKKDKLNFSTKNVNMGVLDFSKEEVEITGRYFNDKEIKIGNEATIENFRKAVSGRSHILLSTHGEANETDAWGSRLYFRNKEGDADFIEAREIALMDLRGTEEVYLSACETAMGKRYTGEGILGMAQVFLIAGVERVIGTLWPACDLHTSKLTINYYKKVHEENKDSLEALLEAKMELMTQPIVEDGETYYGIHPFFWSQFVLIGAKNR